jgi:hypothetical protein
LARAAAPGGGGDASAPPPACGGASECEKGLGFRPSRVAAVKIFYSHGALSGCRFCPENNNFFVVGATDDAGRPVVRLYSVGGPGALRELPHAAFHDGAPRAAPGLEGGPGSSFFEVPLPHPVTALEFARADELLAADAGGHVHSVRVRVRAAGQDPEAPARGGGSGAVVSPRRSGESAAAAAERRRRSSRSRAPRRRSPAARSDDHVGEVLSRPRTVFACDQYGGNSQIPNPGDDDLDKLPQVSVRSMSYTAHNSRLGASSLVFVDSYGRLRVLRRRSRVRASGDGSFQLCHFALGLKQHHTACVSCARSDEVLAGGVDGSIYVYDPRGDADQNQNRANSLGRAVDVQAQCVHVLEGHRKPVRCLAWSPDEELLVSADDGGTVVLWRYEEPLWRRRRREAAAREVLALTSPSTRGAPSGLLRQGVRHVNADAKRGLFSVQHEFGLVGADPRSQAKFLLETPGLDKVQIGILLGQPEPEYRSVLHAFTESIDFAGLGFIEALRHFLMHFHLPGEAQQIDRILQAFGRAFHLENPFFLRSSEECFVLAYSAVVLNTDAHHPRIRQRMSSTDFVATVRGVPGGAEIQNEIILRLYDSIKREKLSLAQDFAAKGSSRLFGRRREHKTPCPMCGRMVYHSKMMAHMEEFHADGHAPIASRAGPPPPVPGRPRTWRVDQ